MATKPGFLTEWPWPWQRLGSFKYVMMVPLVSHSIYLNMMRGGEAGERDLLNCIIFPLLIWRWVHYQIWMSFSRFQTAGSNHLIVKKGIEFEQVDREQNWHDQILLSGILFYLANRNFVWARNLPLWRADGIIMIILLHVGPVEFIYYWLHRTTHRFSYLYTRYHSHHHASIVLEPITAATQSFAELLLYLILFSSPLVATAMSGMGSIIGAVGYVTYIDFMNSLGHCNFELVPKWAFRVFPPLKYLMYTSSFHSIHHTQFRSNYSLYMPFYDYVYGTRDKSSDALYERSRRGEKEVADVVYLTHPTTLNSIYHLRLGLASLASKPSSSSSPKWYIWMLLSPLTVVSVLLHWAFSSTFTVESYRLGKLKMQTWAIPRYNFQYLLPWQRSSINNLIEKAILDAGDEGVKVISLGLLNQSEELNGNGELYLQKHLKLKVRVVDGTTLAVGVVLNSIPFRTKQVLMRGHPSKAAFAIAIALCKRDIQVITVCRDEFDKLKLQLPTELGTRLSLSNSYDAAKVWLVGDGVRDDEQKMAVKGAHFIPFSQFPVKKVRKDCVYHTTPAMRVPKDLENMHSCENWLPRRVMSAWRVAGIVHALEGWDAHECGHKMLNLQQVWDAALLHGFLPMPPQV